MQDIPVVAESDLESFAGHFHQQFPQASLEGEQVFDFKEFLERI